MTDVATVQQQEETCSIDTAWETADGDLGSAAELGNKTRRRRRLLKLSRDTAS